MQSELTHRAEGKRILPNGAVLVSLACLGVLVASRLLPPDGLPGVDLCAFHALTGLPCPGCGLTRAFCALARGHFYEAWQLHPFAFPLFAATLGGLLSPLLELGFPAWAGLRATRLIRMVVIAFTAALLLFGVWRAKGEWDLHHRGPDQPRSAS